MPRLMFVTDRHRSTLSAAELFVAAIAGGCDAIQVRDADAPRHERAALVAAARTAAGGSATVLVNGGVELAWEFGVGLHLPERGLPPSVARAKLGPATLIGRSVHSPVGAAASEGADFLVAGSVFPTESHPGGLPLGLSGLREIVAATELPVLAIGGIEPDRIADVVAAGAYGVCVVGAIARAPDVEAAVAQAGALRKTLDSALEMKGVAITMTTSEQPVSEQAEIEFELNGKPERLPTGTTIATFLAGKDLQDKLVVVEVNGQIVARSAFGERIFRNGDQVEVVHFVGGG
jgi:thiamine-phosphate pyrophosphorylase